MVQWKWSPICAILGDAPPQKPPDTETEKYTEKLCPACKRGWWDSGVMTVEAKRKRIQELKTLPRPAIIERQIKRSLALHRAVIRWLREDPCLWDKPLANIERWTKDRGSMPAPYPKPAFSKHDYTGITLHFY